MKIGILTFHRAENYGAMLQAVALRETLINMGHEVGFIDYWPKEHETLYSIWGNFKTYKNHPTSYLKQLLKALAYSPITIKRKRQFNIFAKKYILNYLYQPEETFDVVIYGSDQIWGRFDFNKFKFDPYFFAENKIKAKHHISYAASMGSVEVNAEEQQFLTSKLKRFSKISVREAEMCTLLQSLKIEPVIKVCDPTLLLTSDQWRNIIPIKRKIREPYALFYDFQHGSFNVESIHKFCRNHSLRLITITAFIRKESFQHNELGTIGPEDFVSLIANADFIFTSSFHGLAFSIIFRKQFYCAYLQKASRAQSLLSILQIPDRMVSKTDSIDLLTTDAIDYNAVSSILLKERNLSIEYLSSI